MVKNELQTFLLESLKPHRLRQAQEGVPSALFDRLEPFKDGEEKNWEFLLEYSQRLHAVAPFLTLVTRSPMSAKLPGSIQKKIDSLLRQERMRLVLLDDLLEESLEILQARKTPVILLKGMDLGRRQYPERILRPMTDVDLLVPTALFQDSIQALLDQGFHVIGPFQRGRFRLELGKEPGGPVVELHHFLQQSDTEESIQGIWSRARAVALPGLERFAKGELPLRTLDPNDFLSYLIQHAGQQHLLESPGWLNDLHFLIQSAEFNEQGNWEEVLRGLYLKQACSAGYFLLWFLSHHWETPLPLEILSTLEKKVPTWKRSFLKDRAQPEHCFPIAGRSVRWTLSSRLLLRDTPWTALQYAAGAFRRHAFK